MASISSSLKVSPLSANSFFAVVAVHDLASERGVARDDFAHLGLDDRQILRRERLVAREIVIEAVLDHRPDGHLRAGVELLHGFRHDMGRVVTDQRQRLLVFPGEDADLGVGLDRLGEVLDLPVKRHGDSLLGQRLGDRLERPRGP